MQEKKEMFKIVDKSTKKNPEEKQYLICISGKDGVEDMWEIVTGRTAAYEFIKNNIEFINLEESFILVESCTLDQRKSIYAFIKHVGNLFEDNFDIEDYIKGDWSEEDYAKTNDISQDLFIETTDKFDITELMNGNVQTTSLA